MSPKRKSDKLKNYNELVGRKKYEWEGEYENSDDLRTLTPEEIL